MGVYQWGRLVLETAIVVMLGWAVLVDTGPAPELLRYQQTIVQTSEDTECMFLSRGEYFVVGTCGPVGSMDSQFAEIQD